MEKKSNILNENSIKKAWSNPMMEKLDVTKTAGSKPSHFKEHNDSGNHGSCMGPGNLSECN